MFGSRYLSACVSSRAIDESQLQTFYPFCDTIVNLLGSCLTSCHIIFLFHCAQVLATVSSFYFCSFSFYILLLIFNAVVFCLRFKICTREIRRETDRNTHTHTNEDTRSVDCLRQFLSIRKKKQFFLCFFRLGGRRRWRRLGVACVDVAVRLFQFYFIFCLFLHDQNVHYLITFFSYFISVARGELEKAEQLIMYDRTDQTNETYGCHGRRRQFVCLTDNTSTREHGSTEFRDFIEKFRLLCRWISQFYDEFGMFGWV